MEYLQRATLESDKHQITIRKMTNDKWHLQAMTGNANSHHIESREFNSYEGALKYTDALLTYLNQK